MVKIATPQTRTASIQNVEIVCKTICKNSCIFLVKLCVQLPTSTKSCVNPPLSHFFPTITPPTYSQPPTPIVQLIYPLFHRAYYHYYK